MSHKNNISYLFIILVGLVWFSNSCSTHKKNQLLDSLQVAPSETLNKDFPDYKEWDWVTIQGKLKMKGLPLSPSLKISMKKDSLIDISIRAPFIGEAGRITLTPDSITALNKMNKTYVNENISDILFLYPGGIGNIQDILLDRFFLPGINLKEVDFDEVVDVIFENGQYNVTPKGVAELETIKYGYIVDNRFTPLSLVILPLMKPDHEVYIIYENKLGGYDIRLIYREGLKEIEATFEMKLPEWDNEVPAPIKIDKKYRKMNISEFLTSIG